MSDPIIRPLPQRSLAPDAERWLEALPAPVLGIDAGERIRFVNAAAAELLAGVGRGLLGRRLDEIFGNDAPIIALARRTLSSASGVAEADVALVGPGFALGHASVAAAPVGENGYIALVLTRPPRARAAPPAAASSAARTLAHEVRNPLAGIRNAFLLIEGAVPQDHPYFSYLSRIEKEIDRIARIVRRMFDLYRPEQERRQPIELDQTICDVVALLDSIAAAHDVRLSVKVTDASDKLRLPEDSIRQVLYNVVVNAIEASPPGGVVCIQSARRDCTVEISVADDGPGISAELRSQIYEPFFTTKEQTSTGGLGLGLPISRGIIEALQGTLQFESRQPQGTVFRFTIPLNGDSGEMDQ